MTHDDHIHPPGIALKALLKVGARVRLTRAIEESERHEGQAFVPMPAGSIGTVEQRLENPGGREFVGVRFDGERSAIVAVPVESLEEIA